MVASVLNRASDPEVEGFGLIRVKSREEMILVAVGRYNVVVTKSSEAKGFDDPFQVSV